MVTLETSFSRLQSLIDKNISLESLEELLFELGFELDSANGDELKIDITPDRIDALSTYGLARIVNSYLGKPHTPLQVQKSNYEVLVDSSVSSVRPKTSCAVVTQLTITEDSLKDIIWLQEKLHDTLGKKRKKAAIGIYPLDKITFPITYCAKKPSQITFTPLEETKELSANEIIQNHPTGKEYGHLLENAKMYPLFVDSKHTILSMPPIINSEQAGRVTTDTNAVFIECSGFDEKTLDFLLTIIVSVFADMGGKVQSVKVGKRQTPVLEHRTISLTSKDVTATLGIELREKEIARLLEKMLYTVSVSKENITVHVPPFRNDIWHKIDVVDDVIRAYGINNVPRVVANVATEGKKLPENIFIESLTEQLVGFGLQEIRTLGVTDKINQFEKMCIKSQNHISLASTAERSINMLRCSIIPELLKCLSQNQNAQHPLNVFEIGDIILPDETFDVRSQNVPTLAVVFCSDTSTFTSVKQLLTTLFQRYAYDLTFKAYDHPSYIKGRCAQVFFKSKKIGVIGEFSTTVLQNWGLLYPAAGFEISLQTIFAHK